MKGFSLVLGFTLPLTIACTLFAQDLILTLLGPKWTGASEIFRLLAPTIVIFAVINPLGWLLTSLGLVYRGLKIALVFAPIMISGYALGLSHGPRGVALGYSAVMILWVIPHIIWCVHGTPVKVVDVLREAVRPLVSSIVAGAAAFGFRVAYGHLFALLPRLTLENAILFVVYAGILLFVTGQKSLYMSLVRDLRSPATLPVNS